jgi:hypothetical protein
VPAAFEREDLELVSGAIGAPYSEFGFAVNRVSS